MSSFIRPAVRAAIWKWREMIGAAGLVLLGLWWSVSVAMPVRFIGYAAIVLGLIFMIGAWQRMRFRSDGAGPGVVKIVERRLAYFGPLTGGAVEMDEVVKLELEPQALPAPHWIIANERGERLEIPVNADGADALFDLFAALPGIQTEKMLNVLSRTPDQRVVIWQVERPLLH